ncbi:MULTISPECIES: DUF2798 domain-containing protein [unclassified Halomonas]|uniref:DUF2798 domain-containing protein n=1 Tax=unclassified Halomonas TaxID=2609666 RepID=UPI0003B8A841|nr:MULTISPECIES: DUF2798 domain-containing protein [unclassified Halomonas]ERS84779.1 hypothetical protein Q671_09865 [Halomonas sp. PBN3]
MFFPPRLAPLVFAVLMSLYMVSLMTFVIIWVNTGLSEGFTGRWWRAFYIAWPIAFALILVGAPRLQRLAAMLIRRPPGQG